MKERKEGGSRETRKEEGRGCRWMASRGGGRERGVHKLHRGREV